MRRGSGGTRPSGATYVVGPAQRLRRTRSGAEAQVSEVLIVPAFARGDPPARTIGKAPCYRQDSNEAGSGCTLGLRQPNSRQCGWKIAENAAHVSTARSVFKQERMTRNDVALLPVRCLEEHLASKNEDPHADRRRMHLAHPAGRQMQEAALAGGRQSGHAERLRGRREVLKCDGDVYGFEVRAAVSVCDESRERKFVGHDSLPARPSVTLSRPGARSATGSAGATSWVATRAYEAALGPARLDQPRTAVAKPATANAETNANPVSQVRSKLPPGSVESAEATATPAATAPPQRTPRRSTRLP